MASRSIQDRFLAKVSKTDTCWLWQAAVRGKHSYGAFWLDGRQQPAHRVMWVLTHGPIPDGLLVLHRCDVPLCVNPDHLFLGATVDNVRDMTEKGRRASTRGDANGNAKLTERDVLSIRADTRLQRVIAADYGVTQSLVSQLKRRAAWVHL